VGELMSWCFFLLFFLRWGGYKSAWLEKGNGAGSLD
jgi:hypothetical protein